MFLFVLMQVIGLSHWLHFWSFAIIRTCRNLLLLFYFIITLLLYQLRFETWKTQMDLNQVNRIFILGQ